ncbi:MAG: hypothetical protein QOK44_1464, partial [Betaproteobacteria bacterium]|nr:hypothetical protein [Betaproteobacteria bacterium]
MWQPEAAAWLVCKLEYAHARTLRYADR